MTIPKLLAIVPARRGSRGVRGKNVQAIGNEPMFAHTVRALIESGTPSRLVVSTDDPLIIAWSRRHGIEVLARSEASARDDATIADVALEVVQHLGWEDIVGVFQPTSPLRSALSIARAWGRFLDERPDSLMSVVREPHLYWHDSGVGGTPRPLFDQRVNRQFGAHRVLRETGGIQLVAVDVLKRVNGMVGRNHLLFELPEAEGLDIDTVRDLAAAKAHFDRGTVVFRLTANRLVGSGHLHHCLQLAQELQDQRVIFLLHECDDFAAEELDAVGHEYLIEDDLVATLHSLRLDGRRVLVNDVLDTNENDVLLPKMAGFAVVNIEDLGSGSRYADAVVNALYRSGDVGSRDQYVGTRYATLRPEFRFLEARETRDIPRRILLTFGGTDPSGLSGRLATALAGLDLEVVLILGTAVPDVEVPGVIVRRGVSNMADELLDADVVVTSAGRTVFEAAATGTPVVVLAQNAREATHSHLGYDTGVIFLGIGALVSDDEVVRVVDRLLRDPALRRELSARLRASIDDSGAERVAQVIRGQVLRSAAVEASS
jgi:CMP-N-acetylneuraminic acid synthetase/spore coat polysaccharide biosynthesis predicted glycosyltransferase SpsG